MLLLITGAACSGKKTLCERVVKYYDLPRFRLQTTDPGKCLGLYDEILPWQAQSCNMRYTERNGFMYGVDLDELSALRTSHAVAVCAISDAYPLYTAAKSVDVDVFVMYLDTPIDVLLSRVPDDTCSRDLTTIINDIYADRTELDSLPIDLKLSTNISEVNYELVIWRPICRFIRQLIQLGGIYANQNRPNHPAANCNATP